VKGTNPDEIYCHKCYIEIMGTNSDQYGFSPVPLTIKNDDGTESITRHYRVNSKGEKIGVFPNQVPQKAQERIETTEDTAAPAES
jgi:hypothetical protein